MENNATAVQTGGARGRKKAPTEGAPKAKRQLITRTESGGLPVEVRRTEEIPMLVIPMFFFSFFFFVFASSFSVVYEYEYAAPPPSPTLEPVLAIYTLVTICRTAACKKYEKPGSL